VTDHLPPADGIDATVPHSARIWNYWMGGKDNYPVDREAGDQYAARFPGIIDMARHSRYFLCRVVDLLARESNVRQFLDIGTGLPTHDNTHDVAQRVAPESRIVYVDNDPLVLIHARALLTSTPQGELRRHRRRSVPPPQPRADRPILRRPGTAGPGRRVVLALAPGPEPLR
jgi:hypothetical protein